MLTGHRGCRIAVLVLCAPLVLAAFHVTLNAAIRAIPLLSQVVPAQTAAAAKGPAPA